jgi:hypothetical protein
LAGCGARTHRWNLCRGDVSRISGARSKRRGDLFRVPFGSECLMTRGSGVPTG